MNRNDKDFLVEKIRTKYTEKENNQLDELKALDRKATIPAEIFAYTLGIMGALVMGFGMSIIMTDFGAAIGIENILVSGIVLGIAGIVIVSINYPIYKKLLTYRQKKFADEIIKLSDKIMKS